MTVATLSPGRKAYRVGFARGIEPVEVLSVAEWAEEHRVLTTETSAEPGPWRNSRTPYLRAIMDALSIDDPCEKVTAVMGAQLGKSESGNNWIGYVVHHAPGPMMAVQPTSQLAKRYSRQRLAPMFRSSELEERMTEHRSRDSANTVLQKDFTGGTIVLAGANSAAELRSMPVKYLFRDEIDAYPDDVDGEGDPLELSEARTRTFAESKILDTSTPTIEGRSKIAAQYEDSDQCEYFVPCPLCDHMQTLKWSAVRWEKGEPETVTYTCEDCEESFGEHHKDEMLARGEWRAKHPERSSRHRGFRISSLYSPLGWFSWEQAARQWERAKGSPLRLQAFVNTVLAETFKNKAEKPDWEVLYNRREKYKPGTVPEGGLLLTAGVDVQGNRLELELVAWGANYETWSVDYVVLPGDPFQADVWRALTEVIDRQYPTEAGPMMRVAGIGIDTGFATQEVYNYVLRRQQSRTFALKGREGTKILVGSSVPVQTTITGKRLKRGLQVWPVDTYMAKHELYGWLRTPLPADWEENGLPDGWAHFPSYGEEYFLGMTAEELVPRIVRGFRKWQWEKVRERNEQLDCRVYARAAAAILGIDRWDPARWKEIAATLSSTQRPAETKRPKRGRSRWLDN